MEKVRGFALVELMVVLLISVLSIGGVSTGFESLLEQLRMRRAASDLNSFFYKARSETMLRGEDLYIRAIQTGSDNIRWSLELRSEHSDTPILLVEGSYTDLHLSGRRDREGGVTLNMDGIKGKIKGSGHLLIRYRSNPQYPLKLVYYGITGRTKICGEGGEFYGFPKC